jgi:hypothetical protein
LSATAPQPADLLGLLLEQTALGDGTDRRCLGARRTESRGLTTRPPRTRLPAPSHRTFALVRGVGTSAVSSSLSSGGLNAQSEAYQPGDYKPGTTNQSPNRQILGIPRQGRPKSAHDPRLASIFYWHWHSPEERHERF